MAGAAPQKRGVLVAAAHTPPPPPAASLSARPYFIVSDRSGGVLYSDHADGVFNSLFLINAQKFAKANVGEKFTGARGPDGLCFTFQKFGRISLMMATGGASGSSSSADVSCAHDDLALELARKSMLFLVFELLVFLHGSAALKQRRFAASREFAQTRELLASLVRAAVVLADTRQSFLVRCVEMLEVGPDIRTRFVKEMKLVGGARGVASAAHALVFVGTRLLAHYSFNKGAELSPTDLLLLSLFCHARFQPTEPFETIGRSCANEEAAPRSSSDDDDDSSSSSEQPSPAADAEEPIFGEAYASLRSGDASADERSAPLRAYIPAIPGTSASAAPFEPRESYDLLHLRAKPAWVYASQMAAEMALVIVCERATGAPSELLPLRRQRERMRSELRDWLSYMCALDAAPVSMLGLPYLGQMPGLVHFVYVDRFKPRMYAPAVSALHGQSVQLSEAQNAAMVATLKRRVWTMVRRGEAFLAHGYQWALWRDGDVQCSYRLWLEDETGSEIHIERALPQNLQGPLSQATYDVLARQLAGARAASLFELYAMFVPTLSIEAVNAHECALINALRRSVLMT